ncbi:hypothetical protein CDAR_219211 [Caerostris darwini]|uniref:Uncharacterized protein n=1 Tax=Caerostris darwini TaxID=1538125 RepID=A0AAV4R2F0_9ARAC|nr:hypothetical protein CDAR_219211 [Caerostris darwini]
MVSYHILTTIKWYAITFKAPSNGTPSHYNHNQMVCHHIRSTIKWYSFTFKEPFNSTPSHSKNHQISFEALLNGMPSHSKHHQMLCIHIITFVTHLMACHNIRSTIKWYDIPFKQSNGMLSHSKYL